MSWRKSAPVQTVSPIRTGQPIVDSQGAPVPAFVRQFNEHWPNVQIAIGNAAKAQAKADAAVPQTRRINTASGELTGGGPLTSDLTLGLASTAVTPGTYGDATHVAQVTFDAKGRATAASNIAISFPASYTDEQAQDAVGNILTDTATIDFTYNDAGNQITADVKAGSIGPTQLANTAVAAGTYGDSTHSLTLTVDAQGRLTAVATNAISGGSGSWIPAVDGAEPPGFITDGAGVLILVAGP